MLASESPTRRIGVIAAGLVLVAGACGESDAPEAGTEAATTTAPAQTTSSTRAPSGGTTASEATTTSDAVATTTTADESNKAPTITADELCELLPAEAIGEVLGAQAAVTTFASPSENATICVLLIFNGETTVNVSFELVGNDGDAGFDEEVRDVARIFGDAAFEIEGVGDKAAGFERNATQILVLAGQAVIRIIGDPVELFSSSEAAAEIGRLAASVFG